MSGTTLAFLIVATVMCTAVLKEYFRSKAKQASAKPAGLDDESQSRINELEERVKVLERIVTSKSERLREEIDAL